MDDVGGKVLRFPLLPKMRIRAMVERCPALGAVSARLPAEDDALRGEGERVLAQAFRLLLHLPDLTREQADAVLDLSCSAEEMVAEELAFLRREPDKAELYEIWSAVWRGEEEPRSKNFARFCVALIARLYRMERFAMSERLGEAALSARSA